MKRAPNTNGRSESGVVAVECAIILPLLALLLVGMVEFGLLVRDHQILQNAAREGAYFAARPRGNPILFPSTAVWEQTIEDVVLDYLLNEGIGPADVTRGDIFVTDYGTEPGCGVPGIDCGRIPAKEITITYDKNLFFGLFSFMGDPITISARAVFANLY